jgi:hypothetical protein
MAAPPPQQQSLEALVSKFPALLQPHEKNLPDEQRAAIVKKRPETAATT